MSNKLCSKENLPKVSQLTTELAFWQSYLKNIVGAIIKRVQLKEKSTNDIISTDEKNETPPVFSNIGRMVWWVEALRTSWRFPIQTPLEARLGLEAQPRYKSPSDFLDKNWEMQWLTSVECGCLSDISPKLAVGQSNSIIAYYIYILHTYNYYIYITITYITTNYIYIININII